VLPGSRAALSAAAKGTILRFLKNLLRQLFDARPLALADKAYLDRATGLGDLERRLHYVERNGSMFLFSPS
jgi:hypothetical protein